MIRVIKNVSWMLIAQIFGLLIPIVEIPILARTLGAESYGRVVMVQSFALLVSLFVEYGFGISGAREVSLAKGKRPLFAKIYNEVFSAKIILSVFTSVVITALIFFGDFNISSETTLFGIMYFVAFGFSPSWFFQGLERLKCVVLVELLVRLTGLATLMFVVREPADHDLALAVMACFALANTLFGNFLAVVITGEVHFSFFFGVNKIRSGYHLFIYKSAGNVLAASGPALVSINSGAQALASFVPAEKVVKGVVGIASSVLVGMFPFINKLFSSGIKSALIIPTIISTGFLAIGVIISFWIAAVAGDIVKMALGEGYDAAAEVLRVFIWIVPLRMANQAMGLTVLIPLRKDRLASTTVLVSSGAAVVLAIYLSSEFGVLGAVAGFVFGELAVFIAFFCFVCRVWADKGHVKVV